MCRLFGLSASPHRVRASFWLLDAPDSLLAQSHPNPDGTGLGFFDRDARPVIDKQPLAAFADPAYEREAKHVTSATFVSHIRYATTGERTVANTHPFAIDGRIFAHNGVIGDLERLDRELGSDLRAVQGDTDSERYGVLVVRHVRERGGDVRAGIAAAAGWIADNLPVYSINFVLASPDELWAFRYPDTHRLFVLEREPGGPHGDRDLHHVSRTLRVHAPPLAERAAVVVASEPLDDSPGWRLLEPGQLVHVGADLSVDSAIVLDHPPAHPIGLDTLLHRSVQNHPTGGE